MYFNFPNNLKMDNFKRSIYAAKAKGAFEKAKMKCTYHGDFDPPKEKHVQTLLWTLQGQNMQTTPESAFGSMTQRLIDSHWCSVLKALIVFHRGIDQVGPGYASRVADLNLSLASFNDPSEKGAAHSRMIQEYYAYVKAKAHNHSRRNSALLAPQAERAKFFSKLDGNELVREIGYLNNQLACLVKIGPTADLALRNYNLKVTQNAVGFILKDGAPLYRTLDLGISQLIEGFDMIDPDSIEVAIDHYKKFEQNTNTLKKFFQLGSMLSNAVGIAPPKFTQRSREVLASLSSYAGDVNPELAVSLSDVKMSKEELEMQKQMLAQFEEEKQKKDRERKESEELMGEEIDEIMPKPPQQVAEAPQAMPQQPQAPPQPSAIDIVMNAFNQPAPGAAPNPAQPDLTGMGGMNPGQQNPAMMQAMMQQFMTQQAMMGGNPMMTNPMMTNPMMPNPMMTNPAMMQNPMMTNPMMPNPMMTNPPMMGNQAQPNIRSNIDPNSAPIGQLGNLNQPHQISGGLFGNQPAAAPANPSANPFGDPFSSAPAPSSNQPQQHKQTDPFGNLPGPSNQGSSNSHNLL